MKVTLVSYTKDARELLIFTKQTRLNMSPGLFEEIKGWPEARKQAELDYMLHTIQSSWEFVDYVFLLEDVPRSFTHQLVRTRTASYAHQSQRLEQSGFNYHIPENVQADETLLVTFEEAMAEAAMSYREMIAAGADAQDAREVLPNAAASNILVKANLRTLHDTMLKRLCVRSQGLMQDVTRSMRHEVIAVHPWAEPFLRVWCAMHGTCQFHNHPMEKCPVKPGVYNPHTGFAYRGGAPDSLEVIHEVWKVNRAAPQPVAHRTDSQG